MQLSRRKLIAITATSALLPALGTAQTSPLASNGWPGDSWVTVDPALVGMRSEIIAQVPEQMAATIPLASGIIVTRNGQIAGEWYQNGFSADQTLYIWSVSKSITNIAVGLLFQEGLLNSLDQTLGELIPERIPAGADPRVREVTIAHLLTMTAGWAWDGRINFSRTAETDDIDSMMLRPFNCDPGECFEYDSGCSNLLAYIVQAFSSELMADYLDSRVFEAIGMSRPVWDVTISGANRGGGGGHLTLRDMARIGLLYGRGGVWQDDRLVDLRWVYRSTHEQSSGIGYTGGTNIGTGPYGYQWWVANRNGYQGFAALGYGGQVIYAVPELDLVVTAGFSGADAARPDLQQSPWFIIDNLIVPAIAD